MRATKEKRGKSHLAIRNKLAILDAAALAKVSEGRYMHVAHQWKLTPQQLNDLVRRNRTYFAGMVKALRKHPTVYRGAKK
jgi:hypothetical protein